MVDVYLVTVFSLYLGLFTGSNAARVAMKIIESPVSFGMNNDLISPNIQGNLELRVQPSNFSGPEHLQELVGKCFNKSDEQYHYSFCPFNNIIQYEISSRWNAYHGILGIWKEWKIRNNTFHAMVMDQGDQCGNFYRSVEVLFECNEINAIKEVGEPSKCRYQMVFETPLVCHRDAMLVYPRLPENLRHQWDLLETEMLHEEITQKGYSKRLREILVQADLQLPEQISKNEHLKSQLDGSEKEFENLGQCMQEINNLKKEIDALKLLLDLNTIPEI